MPIARFPELYGIAAGALMGASNHLIALAAREWAGRETLIRYGWEDINALAFTISGAFAGAFFGAGVRVIYLLAQRKIPYLFVTLMTLGVCLPSYCISKLVAISIKNSLASFITTAISPLIVLLILGAMEWARARKLARTA